VQNFREFDAGPDPFGITWHVRFKWLQTAISIRHSNSVDAKFILDSGTEVQEKTISLPHPELLEVAKQSNTPMTDAWCTRLAMLHLEYLVTSGEDMEKDIVTVSAKEMTAYAARVRNWESEEVRRKRGAA